MVTEAKLRYKAVPIFGLEKIPVEALYSMTRVELGKLQSYVQELEDRVKVLEAENDRLQKELKLDEEKRALRVAIVEAKKEEYVQGLFKGQLTQRQHIEDLKYTNQELYKRIFELTKEVEALKQSVV